MRPIAEAKKTAAALGKRKTKKKKVTKTPQNTHPTFQFSVLSSNWF
jgi:hypothetical protein